MPKPTILTIAQLVNPNISPTISAAIEHATRLNRSERTLNTAQFKSELIPGTPSPFSTAVLSQPSPVAPTKVVPTPTAPVATTLPRKTPWKWVTLAGLGVMAMLAIGIGLVALQLFPRFVDAGNQKDVSTTDNNLVNPPATATFTLTPTFTPTPTPPLVISYSSASQLSLIGQPFNNGERIYYLSLSPDGSLLATNGWYYPPPPAEGSIPEVRLWRVLGTTLIPHLRLTSPDPEEYITHAVFSPDGKRIAVGTASGMIQIWDLEGRSVVQRLSGHTMEISQVAFSPDGRLLASCAEDKTVRVWDTESGQELWQTTLSWEAYSVDFSPDSKLLATGGRASRKEVQLWDSQSGALIRTLTGHGNTVLDVAFSPDGSLLASASIDETVILWDVAQGRLLRQLSGHGDRVQSLAFSPDGSLIASSGNDQQILLWSVQDGTLLNTLLGHLDTIYGLAFTPDGGLLISGSRDMFLRLWAVQP